MSNAQREENAQAKTIDEERDLWLQTHGQTYQRHWHVDFRPFRNLSQFPRPRCVSIQSTRDPRYVSDGRLREWDSWCYFCYTLEGCGAFFDGQTLRDVPAGSGFITEARDPKVRYLYPPNGRELWRFMAFEYTGVPAHSMTQGLNQDHGYVFALDRETPIIQRLLAFEAPGYSTIHPEAVDSAQIVTDLLLALAASVGEASATNAARTLVERAIGIVEADTGNTLNVAALARVAGVSRERLARAFREQIDETPHEVILRTKIRRACFLLKDTDQPIRQIAEALGYTDYTNFIRVFRQATGMPPAQFRRSGSLILMPKSGWER